MVLERRDGGCDDGCLRLRMSLVGIGVGRSEAKLPRV